MTHIATATTRSLPGALLVPVDLVERDPNQPRRDWRHDDGGTRLNELVQSVREFGILQPLVVRRKGDRYLVIAGGRRLVAAKRAGLAEIPVVVRDDEAAHIRILQLIENLQRQNLAPLDEARTYQELMDLEGMTPPAIALRVHVSAQHIRDRLRLLRDQILADAVERRQITASVAREINKLPDEQAEALRRRVHVGARLRVTDVLEVRAQLAARGITNPRRKGATPVRAEAEIEVPTEENALTDIVRPAIVHAVEAPVGPSAPHGEQVLSALPPIASTPQRVSQESGVTPGGVHTPVEIVTRNTRGEPVVAQAREDKPTATASPLNRAEADTRTGPSLDSLVAAVEWSSVEPLLHYGVARGWSCVGLLQNAQRALQSTKRDVGARPLK